MNNSTWHTTVHFGDCLEVLTDFPDDSVDLIITSPPYADARRHTYGGVSPNDYPSWFCDRAEQMYRVLKPSGSFILNIKEKAVGGERHTYVLDLILALKRSVGFRWVEEYIWHKTTSAPGKWKYRFRDAWERLLHFSKSPDIKMNQDSVKVPVGDWTKQRLANMSENDRQRRESATRSKVGRRISAWEGRDWCTQQTFYTALQLLTTLGTVQHSRSGCQSSSSNSSQMRETSYWIRSSDQELPSG